MCHVFGSICYLCVESKLKINTRSLANQALKSAQPSLFSSRRWPYVSLNKDILKQTAGNVKTEAGFFYLI